MTQPVKHQTCTIMLQNTCTLQLALWKIWAASKAKNSQIHYPIIDTVTLLYIQLHPSVLEAATVTKRRHAAAGSMHELPNGAENLPIVALQKGQGMKSKNTHYVWSLLHSTHGCKSIQLTCYSNIDYLPQVITTIWADLPVYSSHPCTS